MKTLNESGISNEILDELKIAVEKQCKEEIEKKSAEIAEKFIRNGYTKEELTFETRIRYGYSELKVSLNVACMTPEGAIEEAFLDSIWINNPNSKYVKELNTVIAKIVAFYNEKAAELMNEVDKTLLSDETPKYYIDINEPILTIPGLRGNMYENDYLIDRRKLSDEMRERVKYHVDRIKATIEAKKQAEIESNRKENAEKEAKKQELKAWALKNGSALLVARIEENMNWVALAENEYDHSRMPQGYDYRDEDDYDSCWDYNNPTLKHIEELRNARKNKVFESVALRKCRKTDEDGDKTFYFFIVATMPGYDGSTVEVSRLIDEEFVTVDEE